MYPNLNKKVKKFPPFFSLVLNTKLENNFFSLIPQVGKDKVYKETLYQWFSTCG